MKTLEDQRVIGKDGRILRTEAEWRRIRAEYESGNEGQRELAKRLGIPANTVMQRAMREKWSQRAHLIRAKAKQLQTELDERQDKLIRDELGPLIERERVRITKRGLRLSHKGMSRIEKMWKEQNPTEAKSEADGARAAETFLRMARTSAGMNEGTGLSGPLNINVLANQALIQASAPVSQIQDNESQN